MRAAVAGVAGVTHETAQLLLPRMVRRSRLYEVTAKNALRIAIELVGGVRDAGTAADATFGAGRVAVKKAAGNVVEVGSIAAFGFSPLWLLAGAADVLNGSRVYLRTLEEELAARGILQPGTHFGSVDALIGSLEGSAGTTASMIDLPPLELTELRNSLAELRADAHNLPAPSEMAALFEGLSHTARAEGQSILDVSSGIGLAFLTSARRVGREHLTTPYREDWAPLHDEGFAAYASRIARPYGRAIGGHFDPRRGTITERLPGYGRRAILWGRSRLRR